MADFIKTGSPKVLQHHVSKQQAGLVNQHNFLQSRDEQTLFLAAPFFSGGQIEQTLHKTFYNCFKPDYLTGATRA